MKLAIVCLATARPAGNRVKAEDVESALDPAGECCLANVAYWPISADAAL